MKSQEYHVRDITITLPQKIYAWKEKIKIDKIFLLEDYLLYRLTGEFVTEKTLQSSTIYYDIHNDTWWKEMLDFIETTGMIIDFDRNYLMRNRDKKHIQRLYELALKFKEKNLLVK